MKKTILSIMIFFCIISYYKINADTLEVTEDPIEITLIQNFYSDIIKKQENGVTIFNYTNKLLSMDLTDNELKEILAQVNGASRLVYYETLNFKVKPVLGTPFEALKGKTTFYRANNAGNWVNAITKTADLNDIANIKDLNNDFWPWGFRLEYRLDPTGTFTNAVPSGADLSNKSLEKQLATVLSIDLTDDPNGVIDSYKTLWRFNPLSGNRIYIARFDFLDEKEGVEPVLDESSTVDYLTNSLALLGTRYVAIRYDRTEEKLTSAEIEENNTEKSNILIYSVILVLLGGSITSYYLYKNKIKIKL